VLDEAISSRVVEVLQPAEMKIAVHAFEELERRRSAMDRQWQLKIERADYEAQLAQRRYEEVDPSNRLVASTLESRWNDALVNVEEVRSQFDVHQKKEGLSEIAQRKSEILSLGKDLPRLWRSKRIQAKDRKRILRLLVKDITIKKEEGEKKVHLQIRWQGGATEEIVVEIPRNAAERWRHSPELVERVREMAKTLRDEEIATTLNQEGLKSNKGNAYTASGIAWIRYKHSISAPDLKRRDELTVKKVADKFNVSTNVVYYWIERKMIKARKLNSGSPWWITLDERTEQELRRRSETSPRITKKRASQRHIAGGAV